MGNLRGLVRLVRIWYPWGCGDSRWHARARVAWRDRSPGERNPPRATSLVYVEAIGYSVRVSQQKGEETNELRYYILSDCLSSKRFSEAVRGHGQIESMHWILDVTFREDDSRTRERTRGNHLSWLRRFAVTLLKRHPVKDSLKGKMIRCLMNPDFLTEVLSLQ